MLLQEASTLLSALATALSNCRLTWPAFLPVHDPLRDAHWGIGTLGGSTVHYDTDSIHLSQNPADLQQVLPLLHRALCLASHAECDLRFSKYACNKVAKKRKITLSGIISGASRPRCSPNAQGGR